MRMATLWICESKPPRRSLSTYDRDQPSLGIEPKTFRLQDWRSPSRGSLSGTMPRYKLVTTRTRTQAPSRAHNGHGKRSDRAPFARAAAYERARCAAIKKDPRPRRAEIPRPMGNTICARAAVATQRHIVIATQREKHKQRNMAIATQRHILIATQREDNETTIATQRQRVIATQRENNQTNMAIATQRQRL